MPRVRTSNCSKCGSEKILLRSGASRCLPCHRRHGREYYLRSESRRTKIRHSHVRRRYGVTFRALEQILENQGGLCAICRRPWRACKPAKRVRYEITFLQYLCIDHDHETGRVRGLLCNACNTAIGLLEEEIGRFYRAVAYLRRALRPGTAWSGTPATAAIANPCRLS
jgi:hypothetical protein